MNTREFYDALMAAANVEQLEKAITDYSSQHAGRIRAVPVGGKSNNRGQIEIATDPGRSLIERVTNAHDAVLEL